jgi:hypothetical protein
VKKVVKCAIRGGGPRTAASVDGIRVYTNPDDDRRLGLDGGFSIAGKAAIRRRNDSFAVTLDLHGNSKREISLAMVQRETAK